MDSMYILKFILFILVAAGGHNGQELSSVEVSSGSYTIYFCKNTVTKDSNCKKINNPHYEPSS